MNQRWFASRWLWVRAVFTVVFASGLVTPALAAGAADAKPSPFVAPVDPAAPSTGAVEKAREHFARGLARFREGVPEAALAEFLRAYELAPSYRLHFNIAQVHYELRNYVGAQRVFRRYLAEGGADIQADRRAQVEGELTKLEALVVQLSIKTSITDAQIAVDEVDVGKVGPANLVVIGVNPGVRRVTAAKPGYLPATLTVTALPGERRRLAFELTPVASPVVLAKMTESDPTNLVAASGTPAAAPSNPKLKAWVTFATTAAFAVSTGIFALATRNAHDDFESQLSRVPNDQPSIDSARTKLKRLALTTDLLAAATAVSTGLFVYFMVAPGSRDEAPRASLGWRGKF